MFVKFVRSRGEKADLFRKNGTCYFLVMNYNKDDNLIMGEEVLML